MLDVERCDCDAAFGIHRIDKRSFPKPLTDLFLYLVDIAERISAKRRYFIDNFFLCVHMWAKAPRPDDED
jgi:hypothetical protein